jgi:hypothetical protein
MGGYCHDAICRLSRRRIQRETGGSSPPQLSRAAPARNHIIEIDFHITAATSSACLAGPGGRC